MSTRELQRAELVGELRQALEQGDLELAYQPVVGLPDGDVAAVKTILTWRHPQQGPLPVTDIVPTTDRSELGAALDRWAFREACRQASERPDDVRSPIIVTVRPGLVAD